MGGDVIGFSLKASSNSQYEEYIYSKNIQNDIIRIYKYGNASWYFNNMQGEGGYFTSVGKIISCWLG